MAHDRLVGRLARRSEGICLRYQINSAGSTNLTNKSLSLSPIFSVPLRRAEFEGAPPLGPSNPLDLPVCLSLTD